MKAEKGTLYNKVYEKHMQSDDSFTTADKGLQNVAQRDKYAYYDGVQYILATPGYECEVCHVAFKKKL